MAKERALPRGRHRLSRETVEESQRRRLLDALVELVATQGYAGTTVGGIAAQAGVSRTTFYELFESKEDIFRAAYEDVAGAMIDYIVAAIDEAGDDPPARLAAGIEAYFGWAAEHPLAARTFILEVHTAGPEALEQRAGIMRRFEQVIARGRPDARPAAVSALIASIDALAHECVRRGEAEQLPELTGAALHVAEKLLS
jgi:TetR/AcrR family transcriptional regulator